MKEKILGRISDEVHKDVTKEAERLNLTVDQFLLVLIQNWKIAKNEKVTK